MPPRFSGTTVPSQIFASDGKRRGVLVACEPVAAVMRDVGMAREQADQFLARKAGRAGHGHADEFLGVRWSPSVSFTTCVHRYCVPDRRAVGDFRS